MKDLKGTTMCFSGHRPEKLQLPLGDDAVVERIKSYLYKDIVDAIGEGYTRFMSGMAKGIDIWAAEVIMDIRNTYKDIKLICVFPYIDHGDGWDGYDRWVLANAASLADECIYVSRDYFKGCMSLRNRYMVEHSSKMTAVVRNFRSGTGQTIRYAEKLGLDIKIIDVNNGV